MSRRALIALTVAVAALLGAAAIVVFVVPKSHSSQVPFPASMSSVGDSITRAFDVDRTHLLSDAPDQSWSTGADPAISSHYDRLLAVAPALAGHASNHARSGAKMDALAAQLQAAAAEHADYVTVLMGANDLCTSTVSAMTPAKAFEAEFRQALGGFLAAAPGAHVLVASIPDLFQLWATLHANPLAVAVWSIARICPAMLSPAATDADRSAVAARELTDNGILQSVCASFTHCRFDGLAVYRARFGAAEVSSVDFFHPSIEGQRRLAAATWAAGFWPSAR